MRKLNPEKLNVNYYDYVTDTTPILERKYTLTHSDTTGDLFLTIGKDFAYDNITPMHDEVLWEWKVIDNTPYLYGYVYITNGEFDNKKSLLRDKIFREELPLALKALRYGDKKLFEEFPTLDDTHIYINFKSSIPELNKMDYFGTISDYNKL